MLRGLKDQKMASTDRIRMVSATRDWKWSVGRALDRAPHAGRRQRAKARDEIQASLVQAIRDLKQKYYL